MDRTENADAVGARRDSPAASGSQSKLSPIILWVLLAAALFRIVTTVSDREKGGTGAGLVKWTAPEGAVAVARSSGKPILYDFTAEWCAPCKMLDRDGWADPGVAALVNDSFIPARIVDRTREDGKNPPWIDALQQRYRVNAFPTLVVAAPDGREIAIANGFNGKQKLVEFLEGSRRKPPSP
ncbi:MAG: thioredoxin family protein [Acidobacteriota bacterium]